MPKQHTIRLQAQSLAGMKEDYLRCALNYAQHGKLAAIVSLHVSSPASPRQHTHMQSLSLVSQTCRWRLPQRLWHCGLWYKAPVCIRQAAQSSYLATIHQAVSGAQHHLSSTLFWPVRASAVLRAPRRLLGVWLRRPPWGASVRCL